MAEANKPKNLLFIHSILDDAGLSPAEFRLICHIARRGVCYSTLAKIAEVTDMSVRTIQKTLKSLVEQGLVLKETKPGRPDIYRLPEPGTLSQKLKSRNSQESKKSKEKGSTSEQQEENTLTNDSVRDFSPNFS
ncbi:helix-turn-helix domain-containing protein [Anabaena sp. CCY 0017]|uniref:helix-turn-helix domain-containing protein n=1 Tax=Anabaena sp. CCY 0017 TaxID=3103866 RepID=UPI0039C6114F